LKAVVRDAHFRAHRAVNTELIRMHWTIGRIILERKNDERWGTGVLARLAGDLQDEFPSMTGLSRTNLLYMRSFAEAWPDLPIVPQAGGQLRTGENRRSENPLGRADEPSAAAPSIVQQAVGQLRTGENRSGEVLPSVMQLPWGHITVLLDKFDDRETRDWYAERAVVAGWSRAVLIERITGQLHRRAGAAPSNFASALPIERSELARALVNDPYDFGFLDPSVWESERTLERGLIARITSVLSELGFGFYFVGNQNKLVVGGEAFRPDLLFFHHELRSYVVLELKTGKFKPEYVGKLNFYCNVIDDQLRKDDEGPTIGILLCAHRNTTVVEYSLQGVGTPMAVPTYRYDDLPDEVRKVLPSPDELVAAVGPFVPEVPAADEGLEE
jgi:predicted nuclease of restriction endonuclease-like (RecB) superfamily